MSAENKTSIDLRQMAEDIKVLEAKGWLDGLRSIQEGRLILTAKQILKSDENPNRN